MREQTCLWICPYARIQGAMVDKQTIMPTYDHYRGEQRGKLKKGQHAEDAIIMAYFYRTVESKYDFSQPMQFENDTYNAENDLAFKGLLGCSD